MLAPEVERRYKALFDKYDVDKSNSIGTFLSLCVISFGHSVIVELSDAKELKTILRVAGMHPTERDLKEMIEYSDANHNGKVFLLFLFVFLNF